MNNSKSGVTLPREMPLPRPAAAGRTRAMVWALLAVLLLGIAAGWLYLRPEKREELREEAADAINDAVSGTPLAGVGDILRDTPPPPPPAVTNPPTASGTLAGRQVTGTLASPMEMPQAYSGAPAGYAEPQAASPETQPPFRATAQGPRLVSPEPAAPATGIQPGQPTGDGRLVFSQEPVVPPREDSRVQASYLSGIADWLADRYRPGPGGGTLAVSVQSLNHLCGVTLAPRAEGGRSGLLRYVFQPSMIDGLYKLYIDRFMTDLDAAARRKSFSAQENRSFHMAVAGRAVLMASALEGILALPDLKQSLEKIDALAQKAVDTNADLATAVFELDELRNGQAGAQQISATQMRVDGITARYRRAVEEYETAQRALAGEIRKHAGQTMDQDSLLYMAAWVERRLSSDPEGKAALEQAAGIFRDLARRCAQAGS